MRTQLVTALKVTGMVLLVVIPGGSLVLLAYTLVRAYRRGESPWKGLKQLRIPRTTASSRSWLPRFGLLGVSQERAAVP